MSDALEEPGPERRGAGHPCHRRPRRHAALTRCAIVAVIAALSGLVLVAMRSLATDTGASPAADPFVDPAAAQVRDWILANLDPSTALLVPASVADDLTRHGHQAERLVVYGGDSGAGADGGRGDAGADGGPGDAGPDGGPGDAGPAVSDWRCCPFLVTLGGSTTPLDTTLPQRLRPAYERSRRLAVFTSGRRRAEVREIFAEEMNVARAALAADRAARLDGARALAENQRLDLSPQARVTLLSGAVDARVVVALVGVTGKHTVAVAGFPVQPGEATADVPRRSVRIARIDGRPVDPQDTATGDVLTFLMSQVPPWRPDALSVGWQGDVPSLTICFRAPSPIGLLTPAP